ncbi:DNA-binding transcriptional regulator, PadR family [Amycolatopsis lurida]|uniref:PadR family transcriptional regulator n=1 Tax=Amycolatopsis lurida NRRL 2430 TaxID=1460371 RepID=A0A2P2FYW6_AMYLU|nr:PadR family transcriptional regulator [Amycolatopsis lurida]KFU81909.1 PadR family transcriptional regulator [Amycolatopsis lurida NRRL 2430]SEC37198.1 DNA-binding transcriptional regulator, PadR family [Amycolatopsis lurida]
MVLSRLILGLLALAPMTGYDLKRHFESTVGHFWVADKAQIYRTLARLVADGLAEVETVAGAGAPDRQEHRITVAGRTALAEWLASEPERHVERDPFLARVFFGADLDDDAFRSLLTARREATRARLERFERTRADADAPDRAARLRLSTLDYGIANLRVELDWLDALAKELA